MCNAKPLADVMNERLASMKAPMKTWVAVWMLGGVLSMASTAGVGAGLFEGAMYRTQYSAQYSTQAQGNPAAPVQDKRQVRDVRNAQQPPPQERPRGHLTEEERRQLHRDLDKANRELYGGNRRRTPPAD